MAFIDQKVSSIDDPNLRLQAKKAIYLTVNGFLTMCAHLGSNQGPKDYESSTLTN